MELLSIHVYPDPILKGVAQEVPDIDRRIRMLAQNMIKMMFSPFGGIGLAAPQVGVGSRLAVIDYTLGRKQEPLVIINPKILTSEGEEVAEEGCLSFPQTFGPVKRAKKIEAEFIDLQGNTMRIVAEDLLARVFQHEIDHLDGILFIERMSKFRRDFLKMCYLKKGKREEK
jgi:peptide deformylase